MAQIIEENDASKAIESLKQNGMYVVLHQGCYEVLHAGHLACFKAAKQYQSQGKRTCLVVGVESDPTLRLNRDQKVRPLFSQDERCEVINNVALVDFVIRFEPSMVIDHSDVPLYIKRLKKLNPDAFLISYNESLPHFQEIMRMQTCECAEAGIAILPVIHHIRTRATDAVDLLSRSPAAVSTNAHLWQPSYRQPSSQGNE
jgi:cytidyltransferase-like protein